MRNSDRVALDRRLRAAEIAAAKLLAKRIVQLLAEESLAASPVDADAIGRGVISLRRLASDTAAVDVPRLLLEAVARHAPIVAARVAAQVGIEIATPALTE